MSVPSYKELPAWLIEDVVTRLGDNPSYTKAFKKTQRGLLIHSSASAMQYVVGVIMILVLAGALYVLHNELLREAVRGHWSAQASEFAKIAIIAFFGLCCVAALVLMTIRRIAWLDMSLSRLTVKTSVFFVGTTKTIDKAQIKAVRLEGRYKGEQGPYWGFSLEPHQGRNFPVTMKMLSDKSDLPTAFDSNKRYKASCEYPRAAWILCRTLDVPIHVVSKDMDHVFRTSKEVPKLTDAEKQDIKEKDEQQIREAKQDVKKTNKQFVVLIAVVILGMIVVSAYDIISSMKVSKFQIIAWSFTAVMLIFGVIMYKFITRNIK